jgi:hypothetical protein
MVFGNGRLCLTANVPAAGLDFELFGGLEGVEADVCGARRAERFWSANPCSIVILDKCHAVGVLGSADYGTCERPREPVCLVEKAEQCVEVCLGNREDDLTRRTSDDLVIGHNQCTSGDLILEPSVVRRIWHLEDQRKIGVEERGQVLPPHGEPVKFKAVVLRDNVEGLPQTRICQRQGRAYQVGVVGIESGGRSAGSFRRSSPRRAFGPG